MGSHKLKFMFLKLA